jgi:N-acetylmuramoyl-L-alanine amidase
MPSILVETGYITNSSDEAYLNSKKGQTEIARAIVNAVKRYRATTSSNASEPIGASQKGKLVGAKS